WWKLVVTEHFIVFFGLGLITILFMAVLSSATARGASTEGLSFLFFQAQNIGAMTYPVVGKMFLVMSGLFLFATQLGVLESATRITSENILLIRHKVTEPVAVGKIFYLILWIEILLGIVLILMGFQEPRLLLTLGAILNAAAMMVAFPLILLLNRLRLPASIRPHWGRQLMLIIGFSFFAYFVYITFSSNMIF
ncbi:Nramp family divalent metal transporter, partial [Candidatus Bathyarchaeota archaeon]|nr:Nramp family divalent metal transporter [Candidatus Bathyarchaeota archaeon]